MQSVRDNEITIAKSSNAVGKTHAAARIAVWWYKCFPNSKVYTAAAPPLSNLQDLLWGEIGDIQIKNPELFQGDTSTSLRIARSKNSYIRGLTIPDDSNPQISESKFSGKHAPYLLFIFDECDAIPDPQYKGMESCLSGGILYRFLGMFNPRSEEGEVNRMIRDGRANVLQLSAFNHPNVLTGENKIPGAVTRGVTIRRIHEWTRPLVEGEDKDSECFELPKFLEGQIAPRQGGGEYPPLKAGFYKIMEPSFSYMVLGQYPAQGSKKLISKEWIAKARARWDLYVAEYGEVPPAGATAIMGLDVGEYGSDSSVPCFRFGGYVERIGRTWNGIDPIVTAENAAHEYKKRNTTVCYVDGTGIGSGVAPYMQRDLCTAVTVKVAEKPTKTCSLGRFSNLRSQIMWTGAEWLRTDSGAMLPPDDMLTEEMLAIEYWKDEGGFIRMTKSDALRTKLKRSPDRFVAWVLTFSPGGFFDDCDLS